MAFVGCTISELSRGLFFRASPPADDAPEQRRSKARPRFAALAPSFLRSYLRKVGALSAYIRREAVSLSTRARRLLFQLSPKLGEAAESFRARSLALVDPCRALVRKTFAFVRRLPRRRVIAIAVLLFVAGVILELRTSWFEAHYFASTARKLIYHLEPGPSPSIRFPQTGPYDERLGYTACRISSINCKPKDTPSLGKPVFLRGCAR
jgi:hypothetical protein